MQPVHYLRFVMNDDGHVCLQTCFRGDAESAFLVMLALAMGMDSRLADAAERFGKLSPREQRYWMSFVYRAGPTEDEMGRGLGPEN